MAKYECTVRHLRKSLGSARHWQPVRSRHSTAQNTSYNSTLRGAVFLRALQQGPDYFKLLALDVAGVAFSHPASFSHHADETLNTF